MDISITDSLPIGGSEHLGMQFGTIDEITPTPALIFSQGGNNQLLPSPLTTNAFVGIIDTGIVTAHENDNGALDSLTHGGKVANLIGREEYWGSNAVGSGRWSDALTGFVEDAANNSHSMAIANLSFDLVQPNDNGELIPRQTLTQTEWEALAYAQQNNVIVVAAAGNDGGIIGALGSASDYFDNVITVGAADGMVRAPYSNFGSGLDLLAPVAESFVGTSASTALITRGIAGLWESNPDLNYQQVLEIVEQSAIDIYTPGPDLESGAGLFNLENALELAQQKPPEPIRIQPSVERIEWEMDAHDHTERPLAISLGRGTSGRIQAEDFQLEGYRGDKIGEISSIGTTREEGTATAKFGGQTGVYTLKVRYFDETDGNASYELKVGGKSYAWTANGNYKGDYPTEQNGVVREFKNVLLTNGSTIQIVGRQDGGERARIDYVDFELGTAVSPAPQSSPSPSLSKQPARSPSPSKSPSLSRLTFQAESFRLQGFVTENSSAASGGKLIKTSGTGRAATNFSGKTGNYDIRVNYFDEADGQSQLSLKAGGRSFNWTASRQFNGNVATTENRTSQTFENIRLQKGSSIELSGQRQGEEYARIDSIELIPSDQLNPSSPVRPVEPAIISSPQSNRNGRANGQFQVIGETIYDPSGREFIVKGVNKFTFDQGSSKQVDQIKNDWKFNTVRLNYFLEGESGQQLHSNIQSYSNNQVVTMVELHDRTGKYWEGNDLTRLKSWFKDLAQRYKDNPYVWFNIANEPGGSKSAQQIDKWLRQHQEVIKVIRDEVGASNPIVVDGHFWGQDVGEWTTDPVKESKSAILGYGNQIKRFGGKTYDNIIFSVHMYDQWTFGESKMANYLDRIEDKDHAVIVGEYGQINNGFPTRDATEAMFKVTAPREIGRIAWVWSAKDSNDLTTSQNGGGEHINDDNTPTNLSWLGQRVWKDNRRSENLHRL